MTDLLTVQGLYAAVQVSDMKAAEGFYSRMLGRAPDDRPMPTLIQWRGVGNAGIQLFLDAAKAGNSRMTIVVPDMAQTAALLERQGIALGAIQSGAFGRIAQLSDPDGNNVTFAEPPPRA